MDNYDDYLKLLAERVLQEGYRGMFFIMRGVPGSGKSYTARKLAGGDDTRIMSADKWFSPKGDPDEYRKKWAKEKLFIAHNWCQGKVRKAMQMGVSPVVLDNTNIKRRDFMPYIDMAKQYQYLYEIHESQSPWWKEIRELLVDPIANQKTIDAWGVRLAEGFDYEGKTIKNEHGVPAEVIQRMMYGLQPFHC